MNLTTNRNLICRSDTLTIGGKGVRFRVTDRTSAYPAFVIRSSDGIASFINQCAHMALELDWNLGVFFDTDGLNLVCATHGALYDPITGACVGGACRGRPLQPIKVIETDGCIYLKDKAYHLISGT